MQNRRLWRGVNLFLLVLAVAVVGGASTVFAVTSSSTNYQITEMQIGAGSSLESCSGEYCASSSVGGLSPEGGSSNSSTASFSSGMSGDDPLLEVIVDSGDSDLGELSVTETKTRTMTVRVRNHLSSGYIMQIVGEPPKYKDHTLQTPASPVPSTPGAEQFGMNVVANSEPQVGSNPAQVPSGESMVSDIADSYKTPNRFMYRSGDVLARSTLVSGQVNYTVSMIVNISSSTPPGHYAGDYSVIVTPVY